MKYGFSNIVAVIQGPHVLQRQITDAFFFSFSIPLLILVFTSLLKRFRNPTSRRQLFIAWSIFIIGLEALNHFSTRPALNAY